ncbi:hypothetical protein GCM10010517_10800 [Streptosporangium fragile]|uniref:Uncharacterized protein n=1 Tax=Streptosporangium fragile TaxID=46186 RepID=A0ABN3VRA3_9ACTN
MIATVVRQAGLEAGLPHDHDGRKAMTAPEHDLDVSTGPSDAPEKKPDPAGSFRKSRWDDVKASHVITLAAVGMVSVVVAASCATESDYDEDRGITADCVASDSLDADGAYLVVDDGKCAYDSSDTYTYHDSSGYSGSSGSGPYHAYHWYYGGKRAGDRVSLGSTVRPADVDISSRGGTVIQRGGFGGRGSSGG